MLAPVERVLPCKANVLVSLSWIILSIDLQRRELKYAVFAASLRFSLLHVISCKHVIDMHYFPQFCWFTPWYLLTAQARFSQSNPTQLFLCTVATATCFVPFVQQVDHGVCYMGQLFSVCGELWLSLPWLCGHRTERSGSRAFGPEPSLGSAIWSASLSTVAVGEKKRNWT